MENFIYTKFAELAEKKRLTAEDKLAIEELAQSYGLTLDKKCPNCYRDAAIQIALANKPKADPQADGEYELYDDVDITIDSYKFGKLRVCPKNCTPANVKTWLAAGIPLRYFKKYPHDSHE